MLIDERYCLIAGALQVSRFHMQQLVLKIEVSSVKIGYFSMIKNLVCFSC